MCNVFAEFLKNSGLYDEIQIGRDNIDQLIDLIDGKCRISVYCNECNEERVFISEPIMIHIDEENDWEYLSDNIKRILKLQADRSSFDIFPNSEKWRWTDVDIEKYTRVIIFSFKCAMNGSHRLDYIVKTDNSKMVKIGQIPSFASLSLPELKIFNHVIDKESLVELRRAQGLFAHGIGVGSFVYLRRVFERIIDKAVEKRIASGINERSEFLGKRIHERVTLLKDDLPVALVENKSVYGILSKGIHELSEDDCIKYFPIINNCIGIILEQWENMRRRNNMEKQLNSDILKIESEIK